MDNSHKQSSSSSPPWSRNKETKMDSILANEDILENILRRVPAVSFASAACVSKSWKKVCYRILSRPKLVSAYSLNESLTDAVKEVLDKVLAEPIQPHFAIVGSGFCLEDTFKSLVESLGSKIPIIVSTVSGIMGRHALTDEFDEVNFERSESDSDDEEIEVCCIALTIGSVPGLKVDAIPLLRQEKASGVAMTNAFVTNIWDYTRSVSGCTSPMGIMIFGHEDINQKPIIDMLDYAMSKETFIVGNEGSYFVYQSRDGARNTFGSADGGTDAVAVAVALIFANDRDKPHGIGEIQFDVGLSKGVVAIGPSYKAVSVRVHGNRTWLTARLEGQQETLYGEEILDNNDELEDTFVTSDLYIGVTKQRKYSIGKEKPGRMTSLAFHGVVDADEQYLYVEGIGMKTGDSFRFYRVDPNAALTTCQTVSRNLKKLKSDHNHSKSTRSAVNRKQVIGGYIFACCGRGKWFSNQSNFNSSPFRENFPDMPLGGIFCNGEVARASKLIGVEGEEENSAHSCSHVYSTVYLLMTCTPPHPMG